MESYIVIDSEQAKLEGVLDKNTSPNAAVICHPHPLYGGNMDNPVVMTIADTFFGKGFTTLRFNFRGTGNSTGVFDNGNKEQEDVRAALSFLIERGYTKIRLAGYSFGARINAQVVSKGCDIEDHIMVSPPLAVMSFDDIEQMPSAGLIVTGADDEVAPADLIQTHMNRWRISPRFEIINDCDHFYFGGLDRLSVILTEYLSSSQ